MISVFSLLSCVYDTSCCELSFLCFGVSCCCCRLLLFGGVGVLCCLFVDCFLLFLGVLRVLVAFLILFSVFCGWCVLWFV